MRNLKDTVISQYAHSPVMLSLIQSWNDAIDPAADLQAFYDTVWNVETAQGWGLDVWGRIVGISRNIDMQPEDEYVGFTQGFTPFAGGTWAGDGDTRRTFRLHDDMYRRVIMFKAMSNIIYAAAPHINRLLRAMFAGRGRAYFVKRGTMAARYVFEFYLHPIERHLVREMLPRPSGVMLDFYEPEAGKTFGFTESKLAPFNEGAFFMGA